jgi:uncharacterized protein YbjT (DUF2867 family)
MIVVTTPTGIIGQQVLKNLADSREALRVIVRDAARLPAHARDRAEVVVGSHGDPAVVDQAFAGAECVFWLAPPDPQAASLEAAYVDFARPACAALKRHGVKRVVGVSALGRGLSSKAGYVTASLAMDDLIASTGVAYRALAMPSFMDNLLRQVDAIKNRGVFLSTIRPGLKAPTCATRDIAAVAAKLVLDHSWSGTAEVPVLGPEDLSHDDMAKIMSEVLGAPVRYQQIPVAALRATMIERGMSEAMAQGRVDMMIAKDAGLDNGVARTPESSTPTTFRQWCEEILKPAVLA